MKVRQKKKDIFSSNNCKNGSSLLNANDRSQRPQNDIFIFPKYKYCQPKFNNKRIYPYPSKQKENKDVCKDWRKLSVIGT